MAWKACVKTILLFLILFVMPFGGIVLDFHAYTQLPNEADVNSVIPESFNLIWRIHILAQESIESNVELFMYNERYLIVVLKGDSSICKVDTYNVRSIPIYFAYRIAPIYRVTATLVGDKLLMVGSDCRNLEFVCIDVDDMSVLWIHRTNYTFTLSTPLFFRLVSYRDIVYVFKWWGLFIPESELKLPYYQVYVVNLTSGSVNVVNLFRKEGFFNGVFNEMVYVTPVVHQGHIVCVFNRAWWDDKYLYFREVVMLCDLHLNVLYSKDAHRLINSNAPSWLLKVFKSNGHLFFIFESCKSCLSERSYLLAEFEIDAVREVFSLHVLLNTTKPKESLKYKSCFYIMFAYSKWFMIYGPAIACYSLNGSKVWMRVLSDPTSSMIETFKFFTAASNGFIILSSFDAFPFIGLIAMNYNGSIYWSKYLEIAHFNPAMHRGLLFHDSKVFVALVNGTLLCIG